MNTLFDEAAVPATWPMRMAPRTFRVAKMAVVNSVSTTTTVATALVEPPPWVPRPVDANGRLRMWPLWWHLSKAWHGPALLNKLPGRGIRRLMLGKNPEGGVHIDVPPKDTGSLANRRHMPTS